jgi:hypothetical protein
LNFGGKNRRNLITRGIAVRGRRSRKRSRFPWFSRQRIARRYAAPRDAKHY